VQQIYIAPAAGVRQLARARSLWEKREVKSDHYLPIISIVSSLEKDYFFRITQYIGDIHTAYTPVLMNTRAQNLTSRLIDEVTTALSKKKKKEKHHSSF
jgi:hypothetical protein